MRGPAGRGERHLCPPAHPRQQAVRGTHDRRRLRRGALNASCGHGHPRLIEAARRQMARLAHYDLVNAAHPPAERITERLAALLPGDLGQTLLVNSGSEATEAAVRIALDHWRNVGEPRDRVVTFAAGYHGSTALALALSGLPYTHSGWADPFPVHRVALPDTALGADRRRRRRAGRPLRRGVRGGAAARRGAGGTAAQRRRRHRTARWTAGPDPALCDQHGTLLVVDEVASATELATLMIEIGAAFGLRCHAMISDMDQPLG
ncbi:aminotransferase class III-fold pyridoxal phosphate-dependent enzyme [Micromonospora echinospora]|uniref:aminotransferase class III-fold pyridoxal phosphate-dependent enzyme n=1 Tax=Micromonospora echinospora TaxID=1877 RepID=UPI0018D50E6D|nr:aminotransferase class III-fold pyridoxal phosphate-dependent enzyme [Micromonospora echinospora]